jgi:G protein-coupled receptor 133
MRMSLIDRAGVRAMVMLLPLLGTTWLLSLLVPVHPAFGYLFILCNSLQGLLIFALHCLSNEEVNLYKKYR